MMTGVEEFYKVRYWFTNLLKLISKAIPISINLINYLISRLYNHLDLLLNIINQNPILLINT